MKNPYTPTSNPAGVTYSASPRWLRRFVILNGILVAVPVMAYVLLYLLVAILNQREIDPITGAPVMYEHFVWIDVEPLFAVAFFLVPNLILAVTFIYGLVRPRRSNG